MCAGYHNRWGGDAGDPDLRCGPIRQRDKSSEGKVTLEFGGPAISQ